MARVWPRANGYPKSYNECLMRAKKAYPRLDEMIFIQPALTSLFHHVPLRKPHFEALEFTLANSSPFFISPHVLMSFCQKKPELFPFPPPAKRYLPSATGLELAPGWIPLPSSKLRYSGDLGSAAIHPEARALRFKPLNPHASIHIPPEARSARDGGAGTATISASWENGANTGLGMPVCFLVT